MPSVPPGAGTAPTVTRTSSRTPVVRPGNVAVRGERRGLLVGARREDEAVDVLEAPAGRFEFDGEPVEQFRVARGAARPAETAATLKLFSDNEA